MNGDDVRDELVADNRTEGGLVAAERTHRDEQIGAAIDAQLVARDEAHDYEWELEPMGDRVVIEHVEQADISAAGVVIAPTRDKRPQEGIVLRVGPGATMLKEGDRVIYSRYSGSEFKIGDGVYLVVEEPHVLMRLRPTPCYARPPSQAFGTCERPKGHRDQHRDSEGSVWESRCHAVGGASHLCTLHENHKGPHASEAGARWMDAH